MEKAGMPLYHFSFVPLPAWEEQNSSKTFSGGALHLSAREGVVAVFCEHMGKHLSLAYAALSPALTLLASGHHSTITAHEALIAAYPPLVPLSTERLSKTLVVSPPKKSILE
jgi:hypothetical protein